MPDLEHFQTQNLFLPAGANPLPNYVAARLLRRPEGHLYLVHTKETDEIANRLIAALKLESSNATKIAVQEANSDNIYNQVSKYAQKKQDVGLNYTGGTKVMAVHAHRAAEANRPDAVFSYLDANSLELKLKQGKTPISYKVVLEVQPNTETLLALHGYSLEPNPSQNSHATTTMQSTISNLQRITVSRSR